MPIKTKIFVFKAFEQMVSLYFYQEKNENSLKLAQTFCQKIKEILANLTQTQPINQYMLKTSYMFLETLFHIESETIFEIIYSEVIPGFYQVIQQLFEQLNQNILTLNTNVKADPLNLSPDN